MIVKEYRNTANYEFEATDIGKKFKVKAESCDGCLEVMFQASITYVGAPDSGYGKEYDAIAPDVVVFDKGVVITNGFFGKVEEVNE
jgi:hypothetical protein